MGPGKGGKPRRANHKALSPFVKGSRLELTPESWRAPSEKTWGTNEVWRGHPHPSNSSEGLFLRLMPEDKGKSLFLLDLWPHNPLVLPEGAAVRAQTEGHHGPGLTREGTESVKWKKPKQWGGMGNPIPARKARTRGRNKSQAHAKAQPHSRARHPALLCLAQAVLSPSLCSLQISEPQEQKKREEQREEEVSTLSSSSARQHPPTPRSKADLLHHRGTESAFCAPCPDRKLRPRE